MKIRNPQASNPEEQIRSKEAPVKPMDTVKRGRDPGPAHKEKCGEEKEEYSIQANLRGQSRGVKEVVKQAVEVQVATKGVKKRVEKN